MTLNIFVIHVHQFVGPINSIFEIQDCQDILQALHE
jgi:hypothetical protein